MMKLQCPNKCGAVIEAADPEVAKKRMEEHVAAEHGGLAERYNSTLQFAQSVAFALASGTQVPKRTARDLHNKVSALLGGPILPEPSPAASEPPQEKAPNEPEVPEEKAPELKAPESPKKDGE